MGRIEELEEMVRDEPEDGLLRFTLGQALYDGGRPADAVVHLQEAVRLQPDHPAGYRYLGQALLACNRIDEAVDCWRQGGAIAETLGMIQARKEMDVFIKRALKSSPGP